MWGAVVVGDLVVVAVAAGIEGREPHGPVAELADAGDLKSPEGNTS